MSLVELLPNLRELSRHDKFRALQFLLLDLAREDGVTLLEPGAIYPIWSPYNAFEAANIMLEELAVRQECSVGSEEHVVEHANSEFEYEL